MLRLPKSLTKGKKARTVPLWWDRATLDDLTAWKQERQEQEAGVGNYFVCVQADGSFGNQIHRNGIRNRWLVACKNLGEERVDDLTIHDGRHSFASHSLAGVRNLAEVRDALGHASIAVTSVYTHVVGDDGEVGDLFAFDE